MSAGAAARALATKVAGNARALAVGRIALRGCKHVGARARCFGAWPDVLDDGAIAIGADFATSGEFGTLRLATAPGGILTIGDAVVLNYGTSITARHLVRIGDGTKIGPYCVIADTDLPLPLPDDDEPRPILIGRDVWIAARVVVRPGAIVGDGAVVAAGSVVEGEIPPGAVASGAPARVLRVVERWRRSAA